MAAQSVFNTSFTLSQYVSLITLLTVQAFPYVVSSFGFQVQPNVCDQERYSWNSSDSTLNITVQPYLPSSPILVSPSFVFLGVGVPCAQCTNRLPIFHFCAFLPSRQLYGLVGSSVPKSKVNHDCCMGILAWGITLASGPCWIKSLFPPFQIMASHITEF